MILAVAFTMGLATSTVTASTVNDDTKKAKKECCSKTADKKDCSAKEVKACTEKKADKK